MPLIGALLNLVGAAAAWLTATLGVDVIKLAAKLGFFATLFTLVLYPGIKALMSVTSSIRYMLQGAFNEVAGNASGGGCVFALLGVDDFLSSFLSILSGAIATYGSFLGAILTYKFSLKAYNYFFKATA